MSEPVWKQNGEPRWNVLDNAFANDDNRIAEVSNTANLVLDGIIDEEAGGIVAYAVSEAAEEIVRVMNAAEESS